MSDYQDERREADELHERNKAEPDSIFNAAFDFLRIKIFNAAFDFLRIKDNRKHRKAPPLQSEVEGILEVKSWRERDQFPSAMNALANLKDGVGFYREVYLYESGGEVMMAVVKRKRQTEKAAAKGIRGSDVFSTKQEAQNGKSNSSKR